jgi:hypothetical protein
MRKLKTDPFFSPYKITSHQDFVRGDYNFQGGLAFLADLRNGTPLLQGKKKKKVT